MKALLFATLMITSLAHATEVVVYDQPTNQADVFNGGEFAINESMGRAWVELTTSTTYSEGVPDTVRVAVKGMSFDKTTQEVIIEDQSGRTVCAIQKRGLFGIKSIKNTRNCTFTTKYHTATYDDGFETGHIQKLRITLNY